MTNTLVDAVARADTKSVKGLLAAGGDPNVVVDGRPALVFALEQKKKAVAKDLIAAGADPNAFGRGGNTPLVAVALGLQDPNLGAMLIDGGANINATGGPESSGLAPLHIAATAKKLEFASWLLDAGADIEATSRKRGDTPLLWCCRSNSGAMNANELAGARLLLSRGANPNAQNKRGENALNLASASGPADFVHELLTTHGAKGVAERNGYTPLHACVYTKFKDQGVWSALLDAGVDVNAQTRHGDTPLHEAVSSRNLHAVKFLLANGADASIRNGDGETPLMCAEKWNRDKILAFLENAAG
jgi:ankyrin repeat protein